MRKGMLLLVILFTSCTAYRNNIKIREGEELHADRLENMDQGDQVRIRLKTGKAFTGKAISTGDEFMMVHVRRRQDQTIYYSQITHIKYDVNKPVTAVKVAGGVIGSVILIWIMIPNKFGSLGGFGF